MGIEGEFSGCGFAPSARCVGVFLCFFPLSGGRWCCSDLAEANPVLQVVGKAGPEHLLLLGLAFNLYRLRHPTTPAGCKQSHLKPFRFRTYEKTPGGPSLPPQVIT
jgi:hypothetical protein